MFHYNGSHIPRKKLLIKNYMCIIVNDALTGHHFDIFHLKTVQLDTEILVESYTWHAIHSIKANDGLAG